MTKAQVKPAVPPARTQAPRRETTRVAFFGAAARGFARDGYWALSLERVAADAGYTRGALYHLFDSKEPPGAPVPHVECGCPVSRSPRAAVVSFV